MLAPQPATLVRFPTWGSLRYNQVLPCWASMALKESEAIVLRTYPLREADLLVTLFTRSEGKVRGVARSAKKSKRRFGGALEPLTYVEAFYEDRERQELARLDSCEVLESPLATKVSYPRAVALGHVAEVLDELLPDREANDAVFRLALSVLAGLRGAGCLDAGHLFRSLDDAADGLFAGFVGVRGLRPRIEWQPGVFSCAGRRIDVRGRQAAGVVGNFRRVANAGGADVSCSGGKFCWHSVAKVKAADLRKFLVQILQRHIEKKLVTAGMLEKIG